MPRAKGPGGMGAGGNRTDRPSTLPQSVAPSKQYGEAAQQLAAQRTIPMASGEVQVPSTATGGPPGPGGQPPPGPGELPPLDAPTNRPTEPVTTGLPSGAGAGPEALKPPDPMVGIASVFNQLGSDAEPETKRLRAILNASLANQAAQ